MPPSGLWRWGQGQAERGDPAPTPFPAADFRELLREAQGNLWEDFSWQLGFPPYPKWRPGQGTGTDAAGGGLRAPSRPHPARGTLGCRCLSVPTFQS